LLNVAQRHVAYNAMQHVEASGTPIWMDDINEELLIAFIEANWHLSGIKLDKNTFWTLSKKPSRLQQIIKKGQAIANQVIIEGIETQTHKEIAQRAGAKLGQGYLWPAIYPGQEK
jgi:EAL domain-containing protein (putative c-di-GMP-specific phosphodiesterase class I)